jgi:diguanylate cyclase (GGDEF)-like protein
VTPARPTRLQLAVLALIAAGKLKAYGITAKEPYAQFPGVPSLVELYGPKLEIQYWHALFAPAATPSAVIEKLNAALQALLDEVGRLRQELETTRKRISHLERMADEDSMLPIANRRAFVRELTRLISYSERYGTAGSVLYFDLNGMKDINDRFGHAAGDEVLRHFARLLVGNVRDSDVVGRLGGDEFGVILAQADEKQARDKAASLVELAQAQPIAWQGETLQLSCAVGIHQYSARQNADEALSKADADMYDEKRRYYAELNKQR